MTADDIRLENHRSASLGSGPGPFGRRRAQILAASTLEDLERVAGRVDPSAPLPEPDEWRPGVRALEARLLEAFPLTLAGCWRSGGRVFIGVVGDVGALARAARSGYPDPERLRFCRQNATLVALRTALREEFIETEEFSVHIGWLDHARNGVRLGVSGDLAAARAHLLSRPHIIEVTLEEQATAC